jgi:hypothetical protein
MINPPNAKPRSKNDSKEIAFKYSGDRNRKGTPNE